MNNDQARAIAGGLQAHSVGGTYPFCVVGIGNGNKTHFEVHNLQTDEVLSCGGVPAKFVYSGFARSVAEEASRLIGPGWTWVKRKPYVPEHRRVVPLTAQQEQARRATDGNTVEPTAAAYKPAHGGYPGDAPWPVVPCDTEGLWPAPGVSRYA